MSPKSIDQGDAGLSKFRTVTGSLLESAGRRFAEAISVSPRKIAKVPESPIQGYIGNGCGTTLCFAQLVPSPMQPETMQVRQR